MMLFLSQSAARLNNNLRSIIQTCVNDAVEIVHCKIRTESERNKAVNELTRHAIF